MRIAYLDVFFGISGDMTLGALVDAGADPDELIAELGKLNVGGWELRFEQVMVQGLGATRASVTRPHDLGHHHHHHDENHHHEHGMTPSELVQIIRDSDLDEPVKIRSVAVIDRLAQVEARAHRVTVERVHFHELGGLDTVIDVVGAVAGLDLLRVERLYCSPIPVGRGFVNTAHGRLPVPVPAVVGLLEGLPTVPLQVNGETVTPTGAAIAAVLASDFGPMPAMTLVSSGFGAGQKEFSEGPNLLRIMVGDSTGESGTRGCCVDEQVLLEANIDDMSPELCGPAQEAVFRAGAVDCWFEPIFMKKNRPAIKLSALAPPQSAEVVADAILHNTTSFGVRQSLVGRHYLEREMRQVQTAYGAVSVKVGMCDGQVLTVAPEFEDCRRLAEQHQVSVRQVYEAAQAEAGKLRPTK
jgi:pyridinium-3,5-bisthiocarboxylic acid mononucleotide nickel chelatase